MDKYIRGYLYDADFHICLVTEFLELVDCNEVDITECQNVLLISQIISEHGETKVAKSISCRKTPELYISALFATLERRINESMNMTLINYRGR
jgi:hypothetical protein